MRVFELWRLESYLAHLSQLHPAIFSEAGSLGSWRSLICQGWLVLSQTPQCLDQTHKVLHSALHTPAIRAQRLRLTDPSALWLGFRCVKEAAVCRGCASSMKPRGQNRDQAIKSMRQEMT